MELRIPTTQTRQARCGPSTSPLLVVAVVAINNHEHLHLPQISAALVPPLSCRWLVRTTARETIAFRPAAAPPPPSSLSGSVRCCAHEFVRPAATISPR